MLNGYKTYIAAAITAAASVIATATYPTDKAGWIALGMSVLMAVMRKITSMTTGV